MAYRTRIPLANSLRIVPFPNQKPIGVNNFSPDLGLFIKQKRNHVNGFNYCYKAQDGDSITVYVDSLSDTILAYLIDEDGNQVTDWSATPGSTVITGNTVTVDGTEYTYNTFRFAIGPIGNTVGTITDGIYHLFMEIQDGTILQYYVSEPINVKSAGWPGTMKIDYRDARNNFDVCFAAELVFRPAEYFSFRLEANMRLSELPTDVTAFTDQNFQTKIIQSIPKRRWQLTAGGTDSAGDSAGIPPYLADKLNRALCCSEVYIDGVRYIRASDAGVKINPLDNYNNLTATVDLEEYTIDSEVVYKPSAEFTVFTLSEGTTEFAVWAFTFTTSSGASVTTPYRAIKNEDDRGAYVDECNALGLPGVFFFRGQDFVYQFGAGEASASFVCIYQYPSSEPNAMLLEGFFRFPIEKTISEGTYYEIIRRMRAQFSYNLTGAPLTDPIGVLVHKGTSTDYPYDLNSYTPLTSNSFLRIDTGYDHNGFIDTTWYYQKNATVVRLDIQSLGFPTGLGVYTSPSRQAEGAMPSSLRYLFMIAHARCPKLDLLVQNCSDLRGIGLSGMPALDGLNQNPFANAKPNFGTWEEGTPGGLRGFVVSGTVAWINLINDVLINTYYVNNVAPYGTSTPRYWECRLEAGTPFYTSGSTTARSVLATAGWTIVTS